MSFEVEIMPSALTELKAVKVFYRRQIAEAIDEQLTQEPFKETKNRKMMKDPNPSFEFEPPLWELRVGTFRVFYDGSEAEQMVFVRAIKEKPSHARTEDVL